MSSSLSTSDSRRHVHKHALGLKWTLAAVTLLSSTPRRSCPREGGQNSHMHMEQPLTHSRCARKRVHASVCVLRREGASRMCLHTKKRGPKWGPTQVFILGRCCYGALGAFNCYIYDLIKCTYTPRSRADVSWQPQSASRADTHPETQCVFTHPRAGTNTPQCFCIL